MPPTRINLKRCPGNEDCLHCGKAIGCWEWAYQVEAGWAHEICWETELDPGNGESPAQVSGNPDDASESAANDITGRLRRIIDRHLGYTPSFLLADLVHEYLVDIEELRNRIHTHISTD